MRASEMARLNRRRHLLRACYARVGACGCRGLVLCRAPATSGGFAGNGRRLRHRSWTSGRFSAGVVRCRLRRLGETPACCGVWGWFGLRDCPEVANGVRLRRRRRVLTRFCLIGADRRPRINKRLNPKRRAGHKPHARMVARQVWSRLPDDRPRQGEGQAGLLPVLFGEEEAREADKARLALGPSARKEWGRRVGASCL